MLVFKVTGVLLGKTIKKNKKGVANGLLAKREKSKSLESSATDLKKGTKERHGAYKHKNAKKAFRLRGYWGGEISEDG